MASKPTYKIVSIHGSIKQITDNYSLLLELQTPIYTTINLHASTILSLHNKSNNTSNNIDSNNSNTNNNNINNNNNNSVNKNNTNNSVNKRTILVLPTSISSIVQGHPSTGLLSGGKVISICDVEFLEVVNRVIHSRSIDIYLEQVYRNQSMAIRFGRK